MPRGIRDFIHELRRRRVFRVVIAYLAVGLGVIYAGDAVLPRLGLENAVVRGVANLPHPQGHDSFLAPLRSDPRFDAVPAEAVRLSGEMAAAAAAAAE